MKHIHQQETPYYESSILPYVCWYQNDFLGGVRGMRAHEIGIYTILLNEMYARGRPLELSPERLARLCGCDKRTFVHVLEMLIKEGKILNLAHGLWNKRCENVFHERVKLLEQKSFAGRSSAKKRKKINEIFQHLLNESARDDEQSSESQKEEEKKTPNGVSEKPLFLSQEEEDESSFSSLPRQQERIKRAAQPSSAAPPHHCAIIPENQENVHAETKNTGKSPTASAAIQDTLLWGNLQSTAEHAHDSMITPENQKVSHANTKNTSKKTTSPTAIPKGQCLPADWQADISAAVLEGLSEEQARWQEKKFRDYWCAKSGKEALKTDWQATWRNWFRREIERIKEHQEKLAVFTSRSKSPSSKAITHNSDIDALYQNLINYNTDEHEYNF
ncbi:YdaU family protein [Bartonella rattaustraliani]|uniref:YdaU family protein n=1 Tax=Bartonella rattaustraliani TaxID=481139 RepID=UPI00030D3C31|nr:DUF1376 domain-containing protein [Bartonella rattaustraliani]